MITITTAGRGANAQQGMARPSRAILGDGLHHVGNANHRFAQFAHIADQNPQRDANQDGAAHRNGSHFNMLNGEGEDLLPLWVMK